MSSSGALEAEQGTKTPAMRGNRGPYTFLPLPGQIGAPLFDGTNVSKFVDTWENLTTGWTDEERITRLVSYCEPVVGKYLKTYATYEEPDWKEFRMEMLKDFKESDTEMQKYTRKYLHKLITTLKKKKEPSAGDYRAFIMEFSDKSEVLVREERLAKLSRIRLFLTAFPVKAGDEILKKNDMFLSDPDSCRERWNDVKKAAIAWLDSRGSQMRKLLREEADDPAGEDEDTPVVKILKNENNAKKEKEKVQKKQEKTDPMDEVIQQLKDLKLQNVEAQGEIAELRSTKLMNCNLEFFSNVNTAIPPISTLPGLRYMGVSHDRASSVHIRFYSSLDAAITPISTLR